MEITLNKEMSSTFYEVISSELKCVINVYDPDTGRVPGKKRVKDGQYARSIVEKWEATQNRIQGFVNLSDIIPCTLTLSDKEFLYSKALLKKAAKELRKELATYQEPYTGILARYYEAAVNAEAIISLMEQK